VTVFFVNTDLAHVNQCALMARFIYIWIMAAGQQTRFSFKLSGKGKLYMDFTKLLRCD